MKKLSFWAICALLLTACQNQDKNMTSKENIKTAIGGLEKPIAKKIDHEMTIHGDTRNDPYFWMRLTDEQKNAKTPDQETQAVLDFLESENDYTNKATAHITNFKDKLFEEIKGRIKQTDMSVPYKENGYFYITRYEEGKEYPIHSRKKESLSADEEIMLDVNKMAEGKDFFNVGGRTISLDNKILGYGEDTMSRRIYTLKFKNLETGKHLDDVIENTTGYCVWGNDNKTIFYVRKDASLRPYKIFRHTLGTDPSTDVEIFHESDETFNTFIYKEKSKKYLIIGSYATLSNEYQILEADNPTGKFRTFTPRERKLEHSLDYYDGNWYILTNKDKAMNFKLMKTSESKTNVADWKEFIPHNKDILLTGTEIFKDYLVLTQRVEGNTAVNIKRWDNTADYYMDFGEEAYTVRTSVNPEFETDTLRISYTSMTTPSSTYDFNMNSKDLNLLKQQEVIGDFNAENYQSEKLMVPAKDGVKIPVSLVYRKGIEKGADTPLLLYAYGSYGSSMDPYFSSVRLSLLDRGFIFAIAHVRGGQEMGRQWYEDGKLLKKKNTFTDFIACGEYLVDNNYTSKEKLFAEGGSAGGLLMGAIMNMRPDLWKGVIAAVPFVDVISTMLDETIPLTTGEFDEWGNPKDKEYYDYIKSYSPYDNVERKEYPATLVTTGYHDSQVQYWEPAKWVAKLRDMKTDDNPLLLKTNMEAGHGGKSGRFRRLEEVAFEYAFFLDLAGWDESEFKN